MFLESFLEGVVAVALGVHKNHNWEPSARKWKMRTFPHRRTQSHPKRQDNWIHQPFPLSVEKVCCELNYLIHESSF